MTNLTDDPATCDVLASIMAARRAEFPALARTEKGRPVVYLDGPAGTQVPRRVPDAVSDALLHRNANRHGAFAVSQDVEAIYSTASERTAAFLGTQDRRGIVWGQNMTSLTGALARSLGRTWAAGDEVVVTGADHDANVTPWTRAAEDAGAVVRTVPIERDSGRITPEALAAVLSNRTRLVAIGGASNLIGTIHDVAALTAVSHQAGALVFVDAVHLAPHRRLAVDAWGCDFLACSSYKFYGPHLGILWGRSDLLATLPSYRLRPAPSEPPESWMTGTQSSEAVAGHAAALDYLLDLGASVAQVVRSNDGPLFGQAVTMSSRSKVDPGDPLPPESALELALAAIASHEGALARTLLQGLAERPAWTVHGLAAPSGWRDRTSTVLVTTPTRSPAELAAGLASEGVYAWGGHSYAVNMASSLGLGDAGGLRLGLMHLTTGDEVSRTLETLDRFVRA